ncbi:MAG: YfdX family protein [Burkholderiales bacterium]|nr:YfdX family protein [Burkholderiales bacterium]
MSTRFPNHRPRGLAIMALSAALACGAAMAAAPAFAATSGASATPATNPQLRLSKAGFATMRAVEEARIAIFEGDVKDAKALVAQAGSDIDKVQADERAMGMSPRDLVPIDGKIVVADDYVDSPQKSARIAEGNKKLHEGKIDEAVKSFKLAGVDIGFSRVLMPVNATRRRISEASGLLTAEKYYEASTVLKAAEDGLTNDTAVVVEAPKAAASAPSKGN